MNSKKAILISVFGLACASILTGCDMESTDVSNESSVVANVGNNNSSLNKENNEVNNQVKQDDKSQNVIEDTAVNVGLEKTNSAATKVENVKEVADKQENIENKVEDETVVKDENKVEDKTVVKDENKVEDETGVKDENKVEDENALKDEVDKQIKLDFRDLPRVREIVVKEDIEDKIVELVNEFRIENGLKPLEKDTKLTETARYKSNSMNQLKYFSHDNPNFNNQRVGYLLWDVFKVDATCIGENIALRSSSTAGLPITAEDIFNKWKQSDGHRANMLKKEFTKIGVGVITSSDNEGFYVYSTQHFSN